jgi:hypothetical protein
MEKEIHNWVEGQYPAQSGGMFMLGIPVSVIQLIHAGIAISSN